MLTYHKQLHFTLQRGDECLRVFSVACTLYSHIHFNLCRTSTRVRSRQLRVAGLGKYVHLGEMCSSKGAQVISFNINLIVNVVHSPIADREPQRYGTVPCTRPEPEAPHAIRCLTLLPYVTVTLAPITLYVQRDLPVGVCIYAASWPLQFGMCQTRINVCRDDIQITINVL
jgi:hypothetical protein